jgi:hypothetical protein
MSPLSNASAIAPARVVLSVKLSPNPVFWESKGIGFGNRRCPAACERRGRGWTPMDTERCFDKCRWLLASGRVGRVGRGFFFSEKGSLETESRCRSLLCSTRMPMGAGRGRSGRVGRMSPRRGVASEQRGKSAHGAKGRPTCPRPLKVNADAGLLKRGAVSGGVQSASNCSGEPCENRSRAGLPT